LEKLLYFVLVAVCNQDGVSFYSDAAEKSCTLNVTFKPTVRSTRTGALKIADNAPNTPQMVSLTGAGNNRLNAF
jgi:hypothetical protein